MDVKDIMIAITIRLDARGPRGVAVSSRRCALLPSSQLAGEHTPCMTNTNTNTKQPTKLPTDRWAQKTKKYNKGGHTKKSTKQFTIQRKSQIKTTAKGGHITKQATKEVCSS